MSANPELSEPIKKEPQAPAKRRTRKKLVFEIGFIDVKDWDYKKAVLPRLQEYGLI